MSYSKNLYKIFQNNQPVELIKKLNTKFTSYKINNEFTIATITDEVKPNSYVASPYTLLIDYNEAKLVLL